MKIKRPHSWRAVILPLCLLVALYLLARRIRSGATADIVWPSLLVLALLMDLATGWRRRHSATRPATEPEGWMLPGRLVCHTSR